MARLLLALVFGAAAVTAVFIDGKGTKNRARALGKQSSLSEYINAALLGSGGSLDPYRTHFYSKKHRQSDVSHNFSFTVPKTPTPSPTSSRKPKSSASSTPSRFPKPSSLPRPSSSSIPSRSPEPSRSSKPSSSPELSSSPQPSSTPSSSLLSTSGADKMRTLRSGSGTKALSPSAVHEPSDSPSPSLQDGVAGGTKISLGKRAAPGTVDSLESSASTSVSASPSASAFVSTSATTSAAASESFSASPNVSISPTISSSPSISASPSTSASPSISASPSGSASPSVSASPSASASPSNVVSVSPSATLHAATTTHAPKTSVAPSSAPALGNKDAQMGQKPLLASASPSYQPAPKIAAPKEQLTPDADDNSWQKDHSRELAWKRGRRTVSSASFANGEFGKGKSKPATFSMIPKEASFSPTPSPKKTSESNAGRSPTKKVYSTSTPCPKTKKHSAPIPPATYKSASGYRSKKSMPKQSFKKPGGNTHMYKSSSDGKKEPKVQVSYTKKQKTYAGPKPAATEKAKGTSTPCPKKQALAATKTPSSHKNTNGHHHRNYSKPKHSSTKPKANTQVHMKTSSEGKKGSHYKIYTSPKAPGSSKSARVNHLDHSKHSGSAKNPTETKAPAQVYYAKKSEVHTERRTPASNKNVNDKHTGKSKTMKSTKNTEAWKRQVKEKPPSEGKKQPNGGNSSKYQLQQSSQKGKMWNASKGTKHRKGNCQSKALKKYSALTLAFRDDAIYDIENGAIVVTLESPEPIDEAMESSEADYFLLSSKMGVLSEPGYSADRSRSIEGEEKVFASMEPEQPSPAALVPAENWNHDTNSGLSGNEHIVNKDYLMEIVHSLQQVLAKSSATSSVTLLDENLSITLRKLTSFLLSEPNKNNAAFEDILATLTELQEKIDFALSTGVIQMQPEDEDAVKSIVTSLIAVLGGDEIDPAESSTDVEMLVASPEGIVPQESFSIALSVTHAEKADVMELASFIVSESAVFLKADPATVTVQKIAYPKDVSEDKRRNFGLLLQFECNGETKCREYRTKYEEFVSNSSLNNAFVKSNFRGSKAQLRSLAAFNRGSYVSGEDYSPKGGDGLSKLQIGLLCGAGVAGLCLVVLIGTIVMKGMKGQSETSYSSNAGPRRDSMRMRWSNALSGEGNDSFLVSNFGGRSRSDSEVSPWMADINQSTLPSLPSAMSRSRGGASALRFARPPPVPSDSNWSASDEERAMPRIATQKDSWVDRT